MNAFTCACHANRYSSCDYPGGCGSTGGCCATQPERRTPRSSICVVCPITRPDSEPRQPNTPAVCVGDRTLLDRWLGDINRLHDALTEPEEPIIDRRQHHRYATAYFPDGKRHTWNKGSYPSDPLAPLGGVAPINSRTNTPTVTGSRERPLPIRADLHDITAPWRAANLTTAGLAHPDDHIGHLPAATVLDGWVRSWRDTLWPGHHLPDGTVTELVKWLRMRLEDACDRYPDIAEFAEQIRNLRGALRGMAGETDPQPEHCIRVPCKRCDLLTLFKQPDSDVHCVNPDCNLVLRAAEYSDWVKTVHGAEKIRASAGETPDQSRTQCLTR